MQRQMFHVGVDVFARSSDYSDRFQARLFNFLGELINGHVRWCSNDDLTIPAMPESNWPFHNNFRSGDLNPVYADNAPDAVPLVDACPFDCDEGVLRLQVRLANKGTATLRHDLKLTIYDIETEEPLVMETISPPIEPGMSSAPFEYAFDASTVGAEGLYVVVDDADGVESIRECDESNNEVWLPEATCW